MRKRPPLTRLTDYTKSNPLRLTIMGPPTTKAGKGRFGRHRVYTPRRQKEADLGISGQAKLALYQLGYLDRDMPIFTGGALEVDLWFYYSTRPTMRDVDNALKSPLDALKGIIYTDDKMITDCHVHKRKDKDRPRIEIAVWELDPEGTR